MNTAESKIDEALVALIEIEQSQVSYAIPPPKGEPAFQYLTGRRPVLISAPHGTMHWRGGRWKQEEEYTSAMARWLAACTGAHALYATRAMRPDPHTDDDAGAYKAALAEVLSAGSIRLVVDLHGVRGDRDFALALGTINGASCPSYEPLMVDHFSAQGFITCDSVPSLDRMVLNHPSYAGGIHHQTVTRFVWQVCGVEAAQLELNAWVRVVKRLETATSHKAAPHFCGEPARIRRLLRALVSLIEALD